MSWVLRRASLDDLPAIMDIEREVFPDDAWAEATMRAELGGADGCYLVAEAAGGAGPIVGYAGLRAPRGFEQADIQTIAVSPVARRHGLGRALMGALLREARDRGAREVLLEVRADNPAARSLYGGLGFEQIAVRPRYYQPAGVDALVMRLELPQPRAVPA